MKAPFAIAIFYGVASLIMVLSTEEAMAQKALSQAYFESWDQDHNGKLTHGEFYNGMVLTGYFENWDTRNDGKLDRQEVQAGLEQLWSFSSGSASLPDLDPFDYQNGIGEGGQPDLDTVFREGDLNRNESLNKSEFYTFIFRFLDTDKNGFLFPLEAHRSRLIIFSGKGVD